MARKKSAPSQPSSICALQPLRPRLQHLVMLLSFTTLAITGLVQKFALNPVSVFIIRLWGGIENVRSTHHVAAILLMLVAVTHLIAHRL